MSKLENIVFMGTPRYAVLVLQGLMKGGYKPTAVFTQPDKPKGRGRGIASSPVKVLAIQEGLPVHQPKRLRKNREVFQLLRNLEPDAIVVAAYGLILPQEVLDIPRYGCINVHASLLPKYRGGAPVNWALINGEKQTGVTIMLMDEGLDTGPILAKKAIDIEDTDTVESLTEKIAIEGADLLIEVLDKLPSGQIKPKPQNDQEATYYPLLKKEDGLINWQLSAEQIYNRVRGLNPWPGTHTFIKGMRLRICAVEILDYDSIEGTPGRFCIDCPKNELWVHCGKGIIKITRFQPEGRREMEAKQFLCGYRDKIGQCFEPGAGNER